ncbi:thiosulfate sulfurtransferase/rhodanese-like domain-containing protein 3-like [Scleropages formosus]|uniref:Sulfurtransferase n=1 Tax=Scleropages formosus TaxID=113540 RepID=A0A0P7V9J3_SCLFO|nr:thiosulfate sulfurtransferase/rhodanese-like domain-containing protein 3-like [Scleropages formosus]
MAVRECLKLTRIVCRVLSSRSYVATACTRELSAVPLRTQCKCALSRATRRAHLLRSFSSIAQAQHSVSHEQLKQLLSSRSAVVIDVREPWELREYGNIPGSVNVPLGQVHQALQMSAEEFREKYGSDMPSQNNLIVFSCLAGVRSKTALDTAISLGYSNVHHYPGGWEEWAKREVLQTKN